MWQQASHAFGLVWSLWCLQLTGSQGAMSQYVDDDEGRIDFSVVLSLKTTRTRNNKPKQ